jgi:hypothetical protein
MRTYSQFGGDAWRNYDEAFCRYAAARDFSDWSNMNVELFNIHTAAVRVPRSASRVQHVGSSTPSSPFFCRSWKIGVALLLAGSVDIVMLAIVWRVGSRIDVFFVLLTSLRKQPGHTQRTS